MLRPESKPRGDTADILPSYQAERPGGACFRSQEVEEYNLEILNSRDRPLKQAGIPVKSLEPYRTPHCVAEAFEIMGKPPGQVPLKWVAELRSLLEKSVGRLEQDELAGQFLALLEQFVPEVFGDMLDHIVERDEVKLLPVDRSEQFVRVRLENIGHQVLVMDPVGFRFCHRWGVRVDADRD